MSYAFFRHAQVPRVAGRTSFARLGASVFADRLMRLFREATFTDVTTVNPPANAPTKTGSLGYIFTWEAYVRSLFR